MSSYVRAHRIQHALWKRGQRLLALTMQARISTVFAMDLHPAARMGKGILIDHGTGVVIGETAVVGDNVSILQGVTLGGTGKDVGDRHPKIGKGVLIGAHSTILGNISVGKGAMIAAGSLVLKPVVRGGGETGSRGWVFQEGLGSRSLLTLRTFMIIVRIGSRALHTTTRSRTSWWRGLRRGKSGWRPPERRRW